MGEIPIPTVIVWMREDILFMRNYLSPERAQTFDKLKKFPFRPSATSGEISWDLSMRSFHSLSREGFVA